LIGLITIALLPTEGINCEISTIRGMNRLSYGVLLESSWTVIVVNASIKEDERGGQGHTSASILHQSAM
jgi:hypothetical protein